MNKWTALLLIVGLLLLLDRVSALNGHKSTSSALTVSTPTSSQTYRANTKDNVTWLTGNNQVVFQYKKNPEPGSDSSYIYAITADDQPQLFYNLDYNVIKVLPFNVGSETFYLVSNLFYQAAGYTLHYATVVDIYRGKTLFKTSETVVKGEFSNISVMDNGDLRISTVWGNYDFCRSCGYFIFDYLGYDGKAFTIKNTRYKDEFRQLLEEVEKNNHCAAVNGGTQLTFEQMKSQYGEDYKCHSSTMTPDMQGISPKEYFALKERVNKILSGEETSLINIY